MITKDGFRHTLLAAVVGSLLAGAGCSASLPLTKATPTWAVPVAPSPTPPTRLASLTPPLLPDGVGLNACQVAMRPGGEEECAALVDLPRYTMALRVDTARSIIEGRERIVFVNREGVDLDTIVLRLYPNLPPSRQWEWPDVGIAVDRVSVDGKRAKSAYQAQNTALAIQLPSPLAAGRKATIELDFAVQLRLDLNSVSALASFYPMLAVHDETGWRQDLSPVGDAVYSESAFYTVHLTVPPAVAVAASGNRVAAVEDSGNDLTSYTYCTGPVRDFVVAMSSHLQTKSRTVDDIAIKVHYTTGSAEGQQALVWASQAVQVFDREFGFYPYAELDAVLVPGFPGGMEYPGLVLVAQDASDDAEFLLAHEVAHQWWYGVVGNDILREPWLDEAFAQYSAIAYLQKCHGEEAASEALARNRSSYQRFVQGGNDAAVGQAVWDFHGNVDYVAVVYNKGAVFLDTLRREVGDQAFFTILQEHYRRHKYGIAQGKDFLAAAQEVSGRPLGELYERWIGK